MASRGLLTALDVATGDIVRATGDLYESLTMTSAELSGRCAVDGTGRTDSPCPTQPPPSRGETTSLCCHAHRWHPSACFSPGPCCTVCGGDNVVWMDTAAETTTTHFAHNPYSRMRSGRIVCDTVRVTQSMRAAVTSLQRTPASDPDGGSQR